MKKILLILTIMSFSFANQYTFLVKKYDKEIELEAKIISNIANSTVNRKLKMYIPNISNEEKRIYSKYIKLVEKCEDSNFIYIKNSSNNITCKNTNQIYFTNNYKKLLHNNKYFGAFFWSKSRPNVVFFKSRLEENHITLQDSYKQFIEVNQ